MLVMPAVLQELMRHESIETTMRCYVGRNTRPTRKILCSAIGKGASSCATGQKAPENEKARDDLSRVSGFRFGGEADGTRTRNLWIDSPVL